MRVPGPAFLALILAANIACSSSAPQTGSDQWQPYPAVPGGYRRILIGDPRRPGPFKFQLKLPAGARVAAHWHSIDVDVKVLSGSVFIIIGEPLEPSRAQRFTAGNVFAVPAHAWHVEWWDEETVLEGEGIGPMETVYKSVIMPESDPTLPRYGTD